MQTPKSTNEGRFGYAGQTWVEELGLNYYKARFYAPKIGRFLQTDPIFYKDDMNLYAYVGGDAVNLTDPSGLSSRVGVTQELINYTWARWHEFHEAYRNNETVEQMKDRKRREDNAARVKPVKDLVCSRVGSFVGQEAVQTADTAGNAAEIAKPGVAAAAIAAGANRAPVPTAQGYLLAETARGLGAAGRMGQGASIVGIGAHTLSGNYSAATFAAVDTAFYAGLAKFAAAGAIESGASSVALSALIAGAYYLGGGSQGLTQMLGGCGN